MDALVKVALRIAAARRQASFNFQRRISEPSIMRNHVDGPMFTALDGQTLWLNPWERLLTKLGVWDAWDIEWRRFPLPLKEATPHAE